MVHSKVCEVLCYPIVENSMLCDMLTIWKVSSVSFLVLSDNP